MNKQFIDFYDVRDHSLMMADRILKDGFYPDVIYILLRGGAVIGNVISEFFKINPQGHHPVYYAAVSARSYQGVGQKDDQIRIEGWTYSPKHLREGDKILLVDDIFDSGNTINYIGQTILKQGIARKDLKIVVHDYKIKKYCNKQVNHPLQPDYWSVKHVIEKESDDHWLHYLSHELVGLTQEERKKWLPHYPPI